MNRYRQLASERQKDRPTNPNVSSRGVVNEAPGHQAPPIVDEVLRTPGQPLDYAERAFFETRFGHDFCQVRIHTGHRAAESARAINSRAYEMGSQVVFATDQFSQGTPQGRLVLAHELVHVVQQRPTSLGLAHGLPLSDHDIHRSVRPLS